MKMVTLTSTIIIMPSRDLLTLLHSDIQCLTSLEFWVYYFAEVTKKRDSALSSVAFFGYILCEIPAQQDSDSKLVIGIVF